VLSCARCLLRLFRLALTVTLIAYLGGLVIILRGHLEVHVCDLVEGGFQTIVLVLNAVVVGADSLVSAPLGHTTAIGS